jgi:hypothetical protein
VNRPDWYMELAASLLAQLHGGGPAHVAIRPVGDPPRPLAEWIAEWLRRDLNVDVSEPDGQGVRFVQPRTEVRS